MSIRFICSYITPKNWICKYF